MKKINNKEAPKKLKDKRNFLGIILGMCLTSIIFLITFPDQIIMYQGILDFIGLSTIFTILALWNSINLSKLYDHISEPKTNSENTKRVGSVYMVEIYLGFSIVFLFIGFILIVLQFLSSWTIIVIFSVVFIAISIQIKYQFFNN